MKKPDIIVICGPTGIGKTTAAIKLANEFNGEIISADSMQVYRLMNIGTAKPTQEERNQITHYMIDIVDPDEHFDAAQFKKKAAVKIIDLNRRGVVPFVAGGTGLYIKALIHGLFEVSPVDKDIRLRLKNEAASISSQALYEKLIKADSSAAKKIHPNDTQRILRALEIYEITGKSISFFHHNHGFSDNPYRVLTICLSMDRNILYDRINRRVDVMMDSGFIDEVKQLLDMGYAENLKSMQSIGYRHLIDFIRGRKSRDETWRILKRDTRRFAKRQLTWFKGDQSIIYKKPSQLEEMHGLINNFLQL